MTDADFLREKAADYERTGMRDTARRIRGIALEHDRMERELTRLMQEGREAHAALQELKP